MPRVPARARARRHDADAEGAREAASRARSCVAAGLANRRGNDYFSGRLLFPLADARGRVLGFQARKLREDDPLRAKYVNSPEGELFRKGDLLYGLDRARAAIAKQDRAVVVEGNTDVLALRQAGIEPVVASMGTALTERQLKELGRLTKRVWLCFDGDAAGEAATLRGMELAVCAGPRRASRRAAAGLRPGRPRRGIRAAARAARRAISATASGSRSNERPTGRRRSSGCARCSRGSRNRRSVRTRSATRRTSSTCRRRRRRASRPVEARSATGRVSPRLLDAGERLERNALAASPPTPHWCRCSPSSGQSISTASSTAACVSSWSSGGERGRRARGPRRRARRPRRLGRDRRAHRRGAAPRLRARRSDGSCTTPIPPARWSCRPRWRRSSLPSRIWPPHRPFRAKRSPDFSG